MDKTYQAWEEKKEREEEQARRVEEANAFFNEHFIFIGIPVK